MGKSNKTENIIRFGNSHLRAVCSKVVVFHKGLHNKIDTITNTLRKHGGGAALAAPQISILKQIVVIEYLNKYYELINPEIIDASGETIDYEGCLSFPNFVGRVKRYKNLKINYQDRMGEFHTVEVKKQMARCFQHEIDHLNGILYIDRMTDEYVTNEINNNQLRVEDLLKLTAERYS